MSIGGILMVLSALMYFFDKSIYIQIAFVIGTLCFVLMQWWQTFETDTLALMRLRKLQIISGIFLLSSAILMLANNFVYEIYTYFKIDIYNYWIVALFIGALLQLYTILRIDKELQKK